MRKCSNGRVISGTNAFYFVSLPNFVGEIVTVKKTS